MVHVRQSLYSLLKPKKKKGNVVNLLGFFSPLMDDCELYGMLEKAGVKHLCEVYPTGDHGIGLGYHTSAKMWSENMLAFFDQNL